MPAGALQLITEAQIVDDGMFFPLSEHPTLRNVRGVPMQS